MGRGIGSLQRARGRLAVAILACALHAPASASAADVNQQTAQHTNAYVNAHGSDDSIDEATRNAMRAFMNLAALNIPGAIEKGYKAYGNYINSEKMDDLEARSKRNRDIMRSASEALMASGKAGPGATAGNDPTASSVSGTVKNYGQMDTGFLYRGETAEVAEEFEKKSGMKRDVFFQHMAAGLDSRPSWDDPNLMDKLEGHFNNFKNAVPNKDFRAGLDSAQNSIPSFARNKIMGEIAGFYADAYKGWKSAVGDNTMLAKSGADEAAPAAGAAETAASASTPSAEGRAPASIAADASPVPVGAVVVAGGKTMGVVARDDDGLFIGLREKDSKDALKDIFSSPAVTLASEQDSLFKTVSKRIRILTPALLGRASVLPSK